MTQRGFLAFISLIAAGVLSACQATHVVLLPQENGTPSAVVVYTRSGHEELSQPYQRATSATGFSQAPVVDQVDESIVRSQYGALFNLAPTKPQLFILYFETGGTALSPASAASLGQVITAAARARKGADIVVTGHTDTQGEVAQNDMLSLRRAQEIRQILINQGFPAARIEAVGRGERELAVPTAEGVNEPRNRRVIIQVR